MAAARRAFTIPLINQSVQQMKATRVEVVASLDRLEAQAVTFPRPVLELPLPSFGLAYHGLNDRIINERIARFFRNTVPDLTTEAAHCKVKQKRRAGDRLRLGVCSMFLRYHTIGHFTRGLIARFPRSEFEVIAIRPNTNPDPMAAEIAQTCDRLVTISHGFRAARQTIAELRLDVLFYPDIGMNQLTYLLAHSRLAPVQCVTWGHPDTTGLDTLDYFLSAKDLEPEQGADDHYTETLIRLNELPTYYHRPTGPADANRCDFGLPESGNLYLCPHTLYKFHPDFDEIMGGILRADETGHVVLVNSHEQATSELQTRLSSVIPDVADRVIFIEKVPNPNFLEFLSLADVVLDTLHFGCGRMVFECTAVGVPTVTLPGDFMRARVVYAVYKRMGITECIVEDQASYIDTAVRLATDRSWRDEIVGRIRERSHLVFERQEAVQEMAAFFKQAVHAADRGERIDHVSTDHA